MVFFTCNGCGSSLKKNQVEKHQSMQCRKSQHLSCMDCCKDFYGDEYQTHTKCISEEEKYGAKGYTPRPNQNKNERKQQEWIALVQDIVSMNANLEPAVRQVLQTISLHENIPRKKPKFMNFLKNVSRNKFNNNQAEQAWNLISKALENKKSENGQKAESGKTSSGQNGSTEVSNQNGDTETSPDGDTEDAETGGKRKKRKLDEGDADPEAAPSKRGKRKKTEANEEDTNGAHDQETAEDHQSEANGDTSESVDPKKFKWSTVAKIVLRAQDDKEISLKKLRKKAVNEYYSRVGNSKGEKSAEDLWAQCLRKLSKNPKFKIHKERIKLVE